MALSRYLNLLDLCVLLVVAVVIVLPERAMTAGKATKLTAEADHALALAEARALVHPDDGLAIMDFERQLSDAGHKDWAVEASARASSKAAGSPSEWRALLATSVAYVERLEVVPALSWGQRALDACKQAGDVACPSWEELRMELYNQHLDAGVKSGIDPRTDPAGFRAAGESGLRMIQLRNVPDPTAAPAPAGSGKPTP